MARTDAVVMDQKQWSLLFLLMQLGMALAFALAVLGAWRKANIDQLRQRAEDAENQVSVLKREVQDLNSQVEDLTRENFDLARKMERVEEQNKRLGRKTLDQQDLIDELERKQKLLVTAMEAHGIRLDALEHHEE